MDRHYRYDLILIASADRNWGIGLGNRLLKRIPEDMKRFAQLTRGNTIVVGRRTLESFKDSKPLPDRTNVVLTRDPDYQCPGAVVVHDIDELMSAIGGFEGKVYVCGGESVYRLLLDYCSLALVTRIDAEFEADTRLPDLDSDSRWVREETGEWQESSVGVRFRYDSYKRRNWVHTQSRT
ncbi:MAG TPA: dihydrofolate reductase [Thermoclostridium sp.]|nr:dihydrofolate reductase [Clostridiaceae bacterium]HOQ76547.1 dihydrofolate reductase [Thermoclostridium sp.]HPU44853.1 dihydrofolate reductase [Thermoclostridium sp.]